MNDKKQIAIIIYMDGSTEQIVPVSMSFYEGAARMFSEQLARLKQQVMINPAPPEKIEESENG